MAPFRYPAAAVAVLALAGCGWLGGDDGMFRDRGGDYLAAKEIPPLTLPEGVSTDAIQDYYFVPAIDAGAQPRAEADVPRPLRLVAGDTDNMVRIQSLGAARWILVQQVPGQIWPRVRDFLLVNGIVVALEDGDAGLLETGWLVPEGATDFERYRFVLRQGLQRNSSEITVVNQVAPAPAAGAPAAEEPWPQVSSDPAREKLFLDTLAQFLAENAELGAAVSLKAQDIDTSTRMYVVNEPVPHINLELVGERAWASLGYALDKAGFVVDDRDADGRIYYTTYTGRDDEEDDRGFWSRLFGLGKQEKVSGSYRVLLQPGTREGWMEIHVEKDGDAFRENELEYLINEIKGYLA